MKQWIRTERRTMSLLYVISLLSGAAMVAQSYSLMKAIDGVFMKNATLTTVAPYIGLFVGAITLRAGATLWQNYLGGKMATNVKQRARTALLQTNYHRLSGEQTSTTLDAVDEIDGYFRVYVPQRIYTTFIVIIALAAIFYTHAPTGWIIVVTAPFIPLFMAIIGQATKAKADEQVAQLTAFSGHFLDRLQGFVSLALWNRTKQQEAEIVARTHSFREATMGVLRQAFVSGLMLEFISMLAIGLVALELCLRLIVFQSIEFAPAFFVLLLTPEVFNALKELGSAFHTGRSSASAVETIERALNETAPPLATGQQSLPSFTSLTFDRVSFAYGDTPVFHEASFTIERGERIVIGGPSGAGKTTLLRLIAWRLDADGMTLNGAPRAQWNVDDWYRTIAVVAQQPFIMAASLRENITFGADSDDVDDIITQCDLQRVIDRLPNGLDTPIGEGARGLSGGEKQRIALARALLKRPALLLLDEPTAGLDVRTTERIDDAMAQLSDEVTVITIAHRRSTLARSTKTLWIDNGTVTVGSHEELLRTVPSYQHVFGGEQR